MNIVQYQRMLSKFLNKLSPFIPLIEQLKKDAATALDPYFEYYVKEIQPQFEIMQKRLVEWQEDRKIEVRELALLGWFPNWTTFFYAPKKEGLDLDEYMIGSFDCYLDSIERLIVEYCPNREDIIKNAFSLHKDKNYAASIPLFLIQSDGICSENFANLFCKNPQSDKRGDAEILEQIENGNIPVNFWNKPLLEPLMIQLQINRSSDKAAKSKYKSSGPNRHGILHGSRKHLDYATAINSYKALSFLAYIVYLVKDEFKNSD